MAPDHDQVQLLSFWASPYVMRAEIALVLKGVAYAKVPQDLPGNKSELLLQSNPVYKKVPVLLHNGKPVCESSIIVQYVDEAWPSPDGRNLLPAEPYGRAIARFWADFVDKKVLDALFGVLKSRKGPEDEKKAAEENAMEVMSRLEEALGREEKEEGPFFGGGRMGLVDVMLVPLLAWLPTFEELGQLNIPFDLKYPRLGAWLAAGKANPATSALPEPPKLTQFMSEVLLPSFVK